MSELLDELEADYETFGKGFLNVLNLRPS